MLVMSIQIKYLHIHFFWNFANRKFLWTVIYHSNVTILLHILLNIYLMNGIYLKLYFTILEDERILQRISVAGNFILSQIS